MYPRLYEKHFKCLVECSNLLQKLKERKDRWFLDSRWWL